MVTQVLLVDDEVELAQATAEYLTLCGIPTTYETDPRRALRLVDGLSPDLLLLDVNMPGMDGFEFCRRVREHSQIPVIFISARNAESDQVLALSIGGDDYITKPFSLAVLLAKVRRVLQRTTSATPTHLTGFQDEWLTVDLATQRVWVSGQDTPVSATEYRLLSHLVQNRGRVVTKEELLDTVWDGPYVSEGTLSVHVRRLRTRIEPDPDNPQYLRTVWGRGYMFEPLTR